MSTESKLSARREALEYPSLASSLAYPLLDFTRFKVGMPGDLVVSSTRGTSMSPPGSCRYGVVEVVAISGVVEIRQVRQ
jgi:hypothetical protein